MAQGLQISAAQINHRIHMVQSITILWMILEAGGSLLAAWKAHSPALIAFGGDSLVELLSASVVLWSFSTLTLQERAERAAARTAGYCFLCSALM